MNHGRITLAAAVAVSLALACSPASVGTADAGPSPDHACSDSAYARCTLLQTCSATAVQLRYGDIGTCESQSKSFCLAVLAAPSSGSTAASNEACAQAISKWDCADYILDQNPPPECQPSTGSLAAGAACAVPQQCQSGFCAIVPGAACGSCAAPPQAGDPCGQLTSCGPSMGCLSFDSTCSAPGQPMGACKPAQACAVGNECIGANYTTGAPGTCQLAVESLGAACSSTTNTCDFYAGLVCQTQMKQCVALQLAGAGQACGYVATLNESVSCGSGGKCLSATPGAQGTCTGSSAVGGPCDLATGPECISPSRCIVGAGGGTSGTCQVPDGTMCP